MIEIVIKYFCYPIHLIYYTTRNCDNINRSRIRTIIVAIPMLLSFFVLPNFYGLIPFAYFYIAFLLFKHEEPIETNNEKEIEMNGDNFPKISHNPSEPLENYVDFDKAMMALTSDFCHPPKHVTFSSQIITLSEPLENSVGWLSIEKNHPIYVFGIENELIVVTEYFGNEIGKIVLDAVNDVEQFVDVECFKLRRNDKRKLACRFVPIGEDDYKIEYLRIMSDRIEVIGVDE